MGRKVRSDLRLHCTAVRLLLLQVALCGHAHLLPRTLALTAFSCKKSGVMRLISGVEKQCHRIPHLRFLMSSYDGDTSCALKMPSCATFTDEVLGHKPMHWLKLLTPSKLGDAQYVWLFDADLALEAFELERALAIMTKTNAALGQPCITASKRSTDYAFLRCAKPMSEMMCEAMHIKQVEVMTPIFTRAAWLHVHRHLLTMLPENYISMVDHGIDMTWCRMLELGAGKRTAPCILMNVSIEHLDSRSMGDWHEAPEKFLLLDELQKRFPNYTRTSPSTRERKGCVIGTVRKH